MTRKALPLLLIPALGVVPLISDAPYFLHMFILIYFYTGLSCAWNIMAMGGKLSLGHNAFFGVGAYASTILFVKYGISPWIGVLAAIACSMAAVALMAVPLLRLRGPMFTLASIAFGEVLRRVAVVWRELTEGSQGLTIPFTPGFLNITFTTPVPHYFIFLVLATLSVLIMHTIYHSAQGHHLRAIASDEEAAAVLGVNTNRVLLKSLVWSGVMTGVLGVFFAQYVYIIDPDWAFSSLLFATQPALNGIIGGMGTVWGPVIGSVLMTPLGEFLRSYLGEMQSGLNFFVYGLVLVLVVMVIPGGIVSAVSPFLRRRFGIRAKTAVIGKGEDS